MKIRCDNCSTVFMIDDALISDKGVKAQCPKCGHQKVVWKHSALQESSWIETPEGQAKSSAGLSDWMDEPISGVLQEKIASMDTGTAARPPLFGASAPPPLYGGGATSGSSSLLPSASASLYPLRDASSDGLYAAGQPLGAGLYPLGEKAAPSPSQDLLPPLGMGYEDSLSKQDFSASSTSMVYTPHGEPEMLSLEEMGDSSSLQLMAPQGVAEARSPKREGESLPVDPEWIKVRRSNDKKEIGPMTLQEVRSLYAHGKITLLDECAGREGVWRLIKAVPEIESILSRTPQITEKSTENKNVTRKADEKGRGGMVWVVLSLLLLGGGAGAAYFLRPYLKGGAKVDPDSEVKQLQAALLQMKIQKWKKSHPNQETNPRNSKEEVKKAFVLNAHDMASSYRTAREVFKRSLVLWEKNADAVAGLSLAYLWGEREAAVRSRFLNEYDVILREQQKKHPNHALLKAAFAAYRSEQGEHEDAFKRIQRVLKKAPKDPLILAIAGEIAFQQTRFQSQARTFLERAVELEPKLLRARYFLADVLSKESSYYKATQQLAPLLKRNHPAGLLLMARLQADMGEFREASQTLQRLIRFSPQDAEARLFLATLSYQALRNTQAANQAFAELRKVSSHRATTRQMLLHQAYLAVDEGKSKKGLGLIEELEKLDRQFLPLLFAKAQLLALKKDYKKAREVLQKLTLQVPGLLPSLFLGLLHERLGEHDKARQSFQQLASEHQRFIWAPLFLAAHALRQKDTTQAFVQIKQSAEIEPRLYRDGLRVENYYLSRRFLRPLVEFFRQAKTDDSSITLAAAGIAAYQLGDEGTALGLLRSARSRDSNALAANLYLAQIAYDQRQYSVAKRHAKQVFVGYNQHPVAASLLGLIAAANKQEKEARMYIQLVEESRPWFLAARAQRLRYLSEKGEKQEMQDIIKSLLTSYRHNHLMLRTLYDIQW
jgi:predicted Zn finger-like uncharacterized protein